MSVAYYFHSIGVVSIIQFVLFLLPSLSYANGIHKQKHKLENVQRMRSTQRTAHDTTHILRITNLTHTKTVPRPYQLFMRPAARVDWKIAQRAKIESRQQSLHSLSTKETESTTMLPPTPPKSSPHRRPSSPRTRASSLAPPRKAYVFCAKCVRWCCVAAYTTRLENVAIRLLWFEL